MLPEEQEGLLPQPAQPEPVAVDSAPAAFVPEKPVREPFWGYGDLALVLGLVVAGFVFLSAIAAVFALAYPNLRNDPTPMLMPVQIASYLLIYLCFWAVFRTKYHRPVLPSLGWRRTQLNLLWAAGGGVLLAILLSSLSLLLHTPKIASPFDKLASSRVNLILLGIVAVTLAPLFEEMFFRGFIQPLLSRTFGTVAGVLVTALLFGSLHIPEYSWVWQYALFVTLAGAVFGWVRVKTNSIIPSTVMHGCFNAVSVVALAFGKNI